MPPKSTRAAQLSSIFTMALGLAVELGATKRRDRWVRAQIRPKGKTVTTRVAKAISYVGAPHSRPFFAVGLTLGVKAYNGRWSPGIIAASIGATAVDKLGRLAIHQQRPRNAGKHHGLDRFAYPSGHTCAITAIATASVCAVAHNTSNQPKNILLASAVLASLATAWSRLYLDEHWIDDVIGGLSAGFAVGVAADAAFD